VVLRVEGFDRTLGERVARHIYVRELPENPISRDGDAVDAGPAGRRDTRPAKKNGGDVAARRQKEGTTP
jgi:hypothetical protein